MKAETKKKLQFLIELGLCQNEINEILDQQEIINQSREFQETEKTKKWVKENIVLE